MSSTANQIAQEQLDLARTAVASIELAMADAQVIIQALSKEYRVSQDFELGKRLRAAKDVFVQHLITKRRLDENLLAAEYSAQLQFANNQ